MARCSSMPSCAPLAESCGCTGGDDSPNGFVSINAHSILQPCPGQAVQSLPDIDTSRVLRFHALDGWAEQEFSRQAELMECSLQGSLTAPCNQQDPCIPHERPPMKPAADEWHGRDVPRQSVAIGHLGNNGGAGLEELPWGGRIVQRGQSCGSRGVEGRTGSAESSARAMLKKAVGQTNALALSEASPHGENIRTWFAEEENAQDDMRDWIQHGSCGFSVTLHEGSLAGPFSGDMMCHHFTWDGLHCVRSQLGSEHANRCSGRLCVHASTRDADKTRLCHRDCSNASGPLSCASSLSCAEAREPGVVELTCTCSHPFRSRCRADECPFVAETGSCPYGDAVSIFKL